MNVEVATPYHVRFHELLEFVRFTDDDVARLHTLATHARPHFEHIARTFYERTREHEDAHRVFQDDEQIERLHVSLIEWLERVLTGPYDLAYVARTAQIGRRHVRVGLPERYMYAAMSLFRSELMRIAFATMNEQAEAVCQALARVLDVELAIMCLTYSESEHERRQRLAQRDVDDGNADAERFRAATDLVDNIVIGIDDDHRIVLFNEQASVVTGFDPEDMLGERFEDVFGCDEDVSFCELVARGLVLPPGSSVKLARVPIPTRSGSVRLLDGRLFRTEIVDDNTCTFVIGRDLTKSLAMEARLRRSEKLAAIGTLAAGLAHEIRNPLNGAQLHVTYIQRGLQQVDGVDDLMSAAGVVSGEIKRLGDLVSEFLEFARPNALQRSKVELAPLAVHCVELVRDTAQRANVTVHLETPTTPLVAEVDKQRVEQVLLNLLRNAVEAAADTSNGTVRLKLFRRPRSAVLLVEDNGRGIDTEAPIWDAFYSTKENGTGLGLAIVHRIVTDHGGSVSVESEPGRTVFKVDLPLYDPEQLPKSMRPTT